MSALFTFIPWLSYWVFLSLGQIHWAVWLAFSAALALTWKEWRAGNLKILTVGTLVFFFLMALLLTLTRPFWLWREISLLGNLALALITLISIVVGQPFTLQYARESTPKERWQAPEFIHANYVITWAWLIAFLFMAVPSAAGHWGIESPIWFTWGFSLCCFAGATAYTNWYKKASRKK
ncbi:MAG: hypothetical protein WC529_00070 [Candidatus Margulisiibacteriota bacterium]